LNILSQIQNNSIIPFFYFNKGVNIIRYKRLTVLNRVFFKKAKGNSIMNGFRIIPVIDIMNGIAVHANKGLRNEYQPIHMKFSQSSKPKDLLAFYLQKFHFTEAYIADLDSIIREKPNLEILSEIIHESTLNIMLDAGIRNLYDIIQFKNLGVDKLILATETIESFGVIDDAVSEIGPEKIIVSIDMKKQHLICECKEFAEMDINSIITQVKKRGISEIILLDLSKIGSLSGGGSSNYTSIRKNHPDLSIIIGGGVKNIQDIHRLKDQGFNGALIATALHKGIISPELVNIFFNSP
jgi:phosphoribosylformimino-5-aminoimidazole carboxamide ribotide isomerase